MQFEQKNIIILDNDRRAHSVLATLGVGTGLAYHHPLTSDGMDLSVYILVHINTGACFPYEFTLPTEPEAQAFLEAVAKLDPDQWNIDLAEYRKRYTGRFQELHRQVEEAYEQA